MGSAPPPRNRRNPHRHLRRTRRPHRSHRPRRQATRLLPFPIHPEKLPRPLPGFLQTTPPTTHPHAFRSSPLGVGRLYAALLGSSCFWTALRLPAVGGRPSPLRYSRVCRLDSSRLLIAGC